MKLQFKLNLQYFASKKGVGSTRNGRDSASQRLGAKLSDGQKTNAGQIIYRQRGTKMHPGHNVGRGKDDTLFALIEGFVKYESYRGNKTKVSVFPTRDYTPAIKRVVKSTEKKTKVAKPNKATAAKKPTAKAAAPKAA